MKGVLGFTKKASPRAGDIKKMVLSLKKLALLALCIPCGTQAATNWQVLKVGAGGAVRGINIAPDGTTVVRTDTNGAYLYNGSSWTQLATYSSMPNNLVAAQTPGFGAGVYEIQVAPSNTNIMYMALNGYVLKSTNKGTTWTNTGFTQLDSYGSDGGLNPNDNYGAGQRMAIDPNNPNIVYLGTQAQGLFVTTNGGTSWSTVSGVPAGTPTPTQGVVGILFYANGPVVGGVTQTIYASSNGHGVYASTNGGTSWTLTSGGPTAVEYAAIDASGNYYAVPTNETTLWKYSSGAWVNTNPPTDNNTIQTVAVNPLQANEVVIGSSAGYLAVSYNGGSTWSTYFNTVITLVSTDIPWLVTANGTSGAGVFTDLLGLAFSATTNGQLIMAAGTGTWTTNIPASGFTLNTPLTYTDFSVGIEQLVALQILVPPVTGSSPILCSWDRPFFKISNLSSYPSTYGPVNSTTPIKCGTIDYASSNPSFVVGIADVGNSEESGYSTDGGATWTNFASAPPNVPGTCQGGTIAASTPQNIIWAPAGKCNPYYTTNQGATWTRITLPGVSSYSGFDFTYILRQRSATADRVNANTFYLYYGGYGVFSTNNGGATWTNVYNGNNGYIGSPAFSGYNSTIMSVPGNAGHLFYTGGAQNGSTASTPVNEPFYRSINGGATWTVVPGVLDVTTFGFGAAAAGQSYPAIYIVGYVNNVFGIWQSVNNAQSWTSIGTYPTGALDLIGTISGDPNNYGAVYVGFSGGGYAYLPAGTAAQSIPMAPANLIVH
jgi:hypothetical protein